MSARHLGELIEVAPTVRAGGEDLPVMSMTMSDGLVDQAQKFKKRVASTDTADYRVVRSGQLVVGFPIDEAVLAFQRRHPAGIVSPAYGIWDVVDDSVVDRSYLERFLRSPHAVAYYKGKLRGSTARRRSLPREVFLAMEVPLPPIEEQRRIVAVLDAANDLRTKRRQVLAKLDTLTQAIFIDMFGDPRGTMWTRTPFSEICDSILGKMLDKKAQSGEYAKPYLRVANVQWFELNLEDIAFMDFRPSDRKTFLLEHGDVLVCEGGSYPGRAAVWRSEIPECYFQKALHRCRPIPGKSNGEFIVHLLAVLDSVGGLDEHKSSSTIAHLTGVKLKAMSVICPPFDAQEQFRERVEAVRDEIEVAGRSTARAGILFASLQQRAFAGEL